MQRQREIEEEVTQRVTEMMKGVTIPIKPLVVPASKKVMGTKPMPQRYKPIAFVKPSPQLSSSSTGSAQPSPASIIATTRSKAQEPLKKATSTQIQQPIEVDEEISVEEVERVF